MGYCPYVCVSCLEVKDNGWEETIFEYSSFTLNKFNNEVPQYIFSVDEYASITLCPLCVEDTFDCSEIQILRKKNLNYIITVDNNRDEDFCWACEFYFCNCKVPSLRDYSTVDECKAANYEKKLDPQYKGICDKAVRKIEFLHATEKNLTMEKRQCQTCKIVFATKSLLNKHLYSSNVQNVCKEKRK